MSSHDPGNSIRWHICADGHLHVDVLGSNNEVVSQFVMAGDDAESFAIEIISDVARWRQFSGDTIGTVEGHA